MRYSLSLLKKTLYAIQQLEIDYNTKYKIPVHYLIIYFYACKNRTRNFFFNSNKLVQFE